MITSKPGVPLAGVAKAEPSVTPIQRWHVVTGTPDCVRRRAGPGTPPAGGGGRG